MSSAKSMSGAQDEKPSTPDKLPAGFVLVYLSLLLSMLLGALDQTIVATTLPTVVGELGGLPLMGWVISSYTLALTISMPAYGKIGDLTGRKMPFLFALITFLLGSAFCGVAQNIEQLIGARFVQGIGGGGLLVLSQTIVADFVPLRRRAQFLAPIGALFGIASAIGPLLGGVLTETVGWRWVFWINLPLGLLAVAAVAWALKLPPKEREMVHVDWLGMVLLSVAVALLTLAGTMLGAEGFSVPALSMLAASAIAAGLFVWVESRAAQPIMPLHLFGNRTFVLAGIMGAVGSLGMIAAGSFMPTFAQMAYGQGAVAAGYLQLPMIVGIMVGLFGSAAWIGKTGQYHVFPIAGMVGMTLSVLLLSTTGNLPSLWVVAAYMALLGISNGCMMQVLVLAVQNDTAEDEVGTATSSNQFIREIGITVGIALIGAAIGSAVSSALTKAGTVLPGFSGEALTPEALESMDAVAREVVVSGYAASIPAIFAWMLPIMLFATVLAFFMPRKRIGDDKSK